MTPRPDVDGAPKGAQHTPARPVVIKIGGRSLEATGSPRELAAEVAALDGAALLVHGGGSTVSDWCARLGVEPRFVDGLRVTDGVTLDVAVAVLAGLANKQLVAKLRDAGVNAIGVSALDAGLVDVEPHDDRARLGRVGAVQGVRRDVIDWMFDHGMTPVVASIGAAGGQLLNLNADEIAGALAGATAARVLVLLSDTPGLMLAGERVSHVRGGELASLLGRTDVQGGMIPKLAAARAALAGGVDRVVIAAWEGAGSLERLLAGQGTCTSITREEQPCLA